MSDPRVDTSAAGADDLQPLATVDPAAYALLLPTGLDHAEAYRHLTALLADSAGAEAAGLFAMPRPAGSRLEFRVPAGRVARFDELDATGRAALRAELSRLISLLRRSAEAKAARDPSRFAPLPTLLRAAIEIPSFEYVYAREGRPVLAAWGLSPHARDGAGVAGGLGLLRVLDDGVPVERPARISALTPMIAALGLGVVGGCALLAGPYLAQAFGPPAPVCKVVPAEREALIGLDDERRRERELRASLAALEQQLGAKRANCPIRVLQPPPAQSPVASTDPAVPPMQRPPDAQPCNAETRSGGAGSTKTQHFLGPKPGPVRLTYDAHNEPDWIVVSHKGRVVTQTDGYRSGKGFIAFDWNPPPGEPRGGYVVTVEVRGTRGSRSTIWTYTLGCPGAR